MNEKELKYISVSIGILLFVNAVLSVVAMNLKIVGGINGWLGLIFNISAGLCFMLSKSTNTASIGGAINFCAYLLVNGVLIATNFVQGFVHYGNDFWSVIGFPPQIANIFNIVASVIILIMTLMVYTRHYTFVKKLHLVPFILTAITFVLSVILCIANLNGTFDITRLFACLFNIVPSVTALLMGKYFTGYAELKK